MATFVEGGGNQKISYKGGEQILDFSGVSEERKNLNDQGEFYPVLEKSGNDLVVIYTNDMNGLKPDSVRLVNYFKTGKKSDIKLKLSADGAAVDIKEFYVSFGYDDFQKGRTITGTFLNDDIDGSQGNDVIKGLDGDDYIKGNGGNDKIYGGKGRNTFVFQDGDGNDTIYYEGGEDIIDLSRVENLNTYEYGDGSRRTEAEKQGNDLIIKYTSSFDETTGKAKCDTIRLANYFKNGENSDIKVTFEYDEAGNQKYIDLKDFVTVDLTFDEAKKGQKITGTFWDDLIDGSNYNDVIHGGKGNDDIYGGLGNDKLYGDYGDNVFEFDVAEYGEEGITFKGDGNDTIYSGKGNDSIRLITDIPTGTYDGYGQPQAKHLTIEDLKISAKGNSLIIYYTNKDSIELADYFKLKDGHSVKEIELYAEEGDGTQKYTIDELVNRFHNTITGKANKKNSLNGGHLNDSIIGGSLADTIKGGNGNDTIIGGKGNDKLYGVSGKNTFEFFRGDGNDIIYSGKGDDLIKLVTDIPTDGVGEYDDPATRPLTVDDIKLSAKGNSLIIHYTDKDSIELADYFKLKDGHSVKEIELYTEDGDGTQKYTIDELVNRFHNTIVGKENKKNSLNGGHLNDSIIGGSLADTIKGGNGNDTIIGGLGNDKLYGVSGKNTFEFFNGDGNDTIYSGKGIDKIILKDVNKDDIIVTKNGKNLVFQYSENDSITISNYLKNPDASSVKTIQIGDESYSIEDFINEKGYEYALKVNNSKKSVGDTINGSRLNDSIIGSKGDDVISGGRGHDTLKGGAGDDIIYGGTGNDKLYGEAGNNKIVFKTDDGDDTVYMGKGNDSLLFAQNTLDYIRYEKSKNNLIIKYGEGDSVTVNNYFSTKNKSVDTIATISDYDHPENIEKSVSLKDDIITKSSSRTMYFSDEDRDIPADCYDGNEYNNLIVANNNKKLNYVEAGAGDDIIYCQGKQVIANGEGGDDTYVISSLKNATIINDTEGENYIQIEDKSSNVNLIFNVSTEENDLDGYNGMYILNKSTLSSLIKSRNIDKVTSGVEVEEFFSNDGNIGNGVIQQIETSNGYYVTFYDIDRVRENVASWLTENGYTSALDAFERGDKSSINELVAIYQNIEWQQPGM